MNEVERIRREYARRATDPYLDGLYSSYNKGYLFATQVRERAVLDLLSRHEISPLSEKRILDVGCGKGTELRRLQSYGASPRNLFGVDLLPERLLQGFRQAPNLHLVTGNGERLPFPDAAFDLCLQFTTFSSVLDGGMKQAISSEMLRVLAPTGAILWYDYWLNPTNPQTKGINTTEMKRLFAGCDFDFRRVTLAPPIARRLAKLSWLACELLERIPWLTTHYLVLIRRKSLSC